MKLRVCNFLITLVGGWSAFFPTLVMADENFNQQPDGAFLEFLAGMTDVNGEVTDPLDMLEITESELIENSNFNKTEQNHKDIESKIEIKERRSPQKSLLNEKTMVINKQQTLVTISRDKSLEQESQL